MADQKTTQLPENIDPQPGDQLYLIDDPLGTPASNRITLATLFTNISSTVTASKAGNAAKFTNTTDSASVQVAIFEGNRATPAAGDEAYVSLQLSDSAGNQDEVGRMTWVLTDETSTTEDGRIEIATIVGGTLQATPTLSIDGNNVGIGTTTFDGSAAGVLAIANGTAPLSGTAGQSYLYAKDVLASSEMHVMDEAGNETQISPHDPDTGEWIFYSKNIHTGEVLRVEMEKLVKFIDKEFGTSFVKEFSE